MIKFDEDTIALLNEGFDSADIWADLYRVGNFSRALLSKPLFVLCHEKS